MIGFPIHYSHLLAYFIYTDVNMVYVVSSSSVLDKLIHSGNNMSQENPANSIKKPSRSVRNGRKYQYKRLNGPYDAIVIGSGIGGLTAAASLSEMGKKSSGT